MSEGRCVALRCVALRCVALRCVALCCVVKGRAKLTYARLQEKCNKAAASTWNYSQYDKPDSTPKATSQGKHCCWQRNAPATRGDWLRLQHKLGHYRENTEGEASKHTIRNMQGWYNKPHRQAVCHHKGEEDKGSRCIHPLLWHFDGIDMETSGAIKHPVTAKQLRLPIWFVNTSLMSNCMTYHHK